MVSSVAFFVSKSPLAHLASMELAGPRGYSLSYAVPAWDVNTVVRVACRYLAKQLLLPSHRCGDPGALGSVAHALLNDVRVLSQYAHIGSKPVTHSEAAEARRDVCDPDAEAHPAGEPGSHGGAIPLPRLRRGRRQRLGFCTVGQTNRLLALNDGVHRQAKLL